MHLDSAAAPDPGAVPETNARRHSRRVPLKNTAALRVRGDEYLAKTCDLSENGLGLFAERCPAEPGDAVEVDVLFGTVLKTFRGVVASAEVLGEARRLGVCFGD